MGNIISILLWVVFIALVGCVLILGPSTVSVDNRVKRPVLEVPEDTGISGIDWIEW